MRYLPPILLAAFLLATPAAAFSVATGLPNLTYPAEPVTQSCVSPATVRVDCRPGR